MSSADPRPSNMGMRSSTLERAVFRLAKEGVALEEIAPGIDIEKDVISKMSFAYSQIIGTANG
ncbi:MAG: hypothetical protein ACJ703_04525 [Nitrososphaera sp.]